MTQLSAVEIRSADVEVYEALRREIIRGLPPGTPLRLAELASRFNVSTMPVRSAIARLEAEGLLVQRPRRGATVTELTVEDFEDIYAIRTALEVTAARLGSTAVSDADLDRMRTCHHKMTELTQNTDETVDSYLELAWQFSNICYEASGRPQLLRLIRTYQRNAERYFRLYLGDRLVFDSELEHQTALLRACEDHDPERAEGAIHRLFQSTIDQIMPRLAEGVRK